MRLRRRAYGAGLGPIRTPAGAADTTSAVAAGSHPVKDGRLDLLPPASRHTMDAMDMKLELVAVPVTDVDRAKAFYVDQVGFNADHDHVVTDALRFVQPTPPDPAARSPSAPA